MTRYIEHPIPDPDGWTDWYAPTGQEDGDPDYKAACCDCGLVHRFQFRLRDLDDGTQRLVMRAKRDERATAAKRRYMRRIL